MVCTAAFSGECHGVHCCIATAPLVSVMVCTDVRDTNVYCSIIQRFLKKFIKFPDYTRSVNAIYSKYRYFIA